MYELNRIQPQGQPQDYQTFQITSPLSSHWINVSCEEAECPNQINGWKTVIDETTGLGQKQGYYIRNSSGRKYTEQRNAALTTFIFPPDQQCFEQHRVRGGRPELYLVKQGDWRGNPRGSAPRVHVRPEDWVDDFANHQQKLAEKIERG